MGEQTSTARPTRQIWLLGHPVAHSLSPTLHNAAFRHQGLGFRYVGHDVPPAALAEAVSDMRSLDVRGANLTLPHKETVSAFLDSITGDARAIGAVNTIVNQDGRLRGYNTDVAGFRAALRTLLPAGAGGLDCLVLGAGGAGKAVVAALLPDRPKRVWVANRTLQRAVALCEALGSDADPPCMPLDLEDAADVLRDAELVVNATSLGLPDSVKKFPLDVDTLHGGQVLVDLVYGRVPTALVRSAREKGVLAMDGKEMLIQQAARAYELWTDREAPLEVMRESIDSLEE